MLSDIRPFRGRRTIREKGELFEGTIPDANAGREILEGKTEIRAYGHIYDARACAR